MPAGFVFNMTADDANGRRQNRVFAQNNLTSQAVTVGPCAGASYPGGGTYGNGKCLPLPDVERLNNPGLSG